MMLHAAQGRKEDDVNKRTKEERCCECDDLTGRAGRCDDSLYAARNDTKDEIGPLCHECFQKLLDAGTIDKEAM